MNWNIIDLPVEDIYGKTHIGFAPIFKESVFLFKKMGYERVLDIGYGYGKHSIYLSEKGFDVTTIASSEQSIEWLRGYMDRNSINNINLIEASINDLPFEDDTFDAIICSSVIHRENFDEIKNSISEIYRVLKESGCILIDFMSLEDNSFGLGKEIDINNLKELLKDFVNIKVLKNEYHIAIDQKNKINRRVLDVLAYKVNL